jgi:SAM-dependent methyltransferase
VGELKKGRALVPGCGKGYDVALLASWGYDAYGLEVSKHAGDAAREYLKSAGEGGEGEYAVKKEGSGRGKMECVVGDFFDEGWREEAGGLEGGFEIIYDNTVGCCCLSTSGMNGELTPTVSLRTPALSTA